MITLTDINGRKVLLHPDQIACITEAGVSQAWHGIRANVQRAVDGRWTGVRETVEDIRAKLAAAKGA